MNDQMLLPGFVRRRAVERKNSAPNQNDQNRLLLLRVAAEMGGFGKIPRIDVDHRGDASR